MMAASAAAAAPSLLAYNLSPSPTFLNQALALALWAGFVLACAPRAPGRGAWVLLCAALALVGLGVLGSSSLGTLPSSLGLSAMGLLFAAGITTAAGVAAGRSERAGGLFAAFATGWVIAGLLNMLIALVQVFAPGLADGDWIATTSLPGRAVGNLRQPNHLSSLLLWSVIATLALAEMGRLRQRLAAALMALFVFGVVLTASRTGVVSVLLLALWGLADRRLAPRSRLMLLAAPLLYALAWAAMAQWAALSHSTFGGAQRIAESGGDISSSRFAIWANTLSMIRSAPWLGVGFGEFNFAWTLTPFPGRPTAFFDHTHNLPLQLAVELGLPLATAVMALLLAALWRAARAAWTAPAADAGGTGARAAVLMVLMIGLHSLLEYPLWYAYFLLPAAWAWGFALGTPGKAGTMDAADAAGAAATSTTRHVDHDEPRAPASPLLTLGALAIVVGAALSVVDYMRVAVIFSSGDEAAPLAQRIEAGRRSLLFSHHADYAAVTSGVPLRDGAASYANTSHYLLDTRLMVAWAEWLAAQGELDRARFLAERLREFHSVDADEFLAPCPQRAEPAAAAAASAASASAAPPFQCELPQRAFDWHEFAHRDAARQLGR